MAGIGFTLRKIMARQTIGSTVAAMVSGLFVVAGPWLFAMANLALIAVLAGGEGQSSLLYAVLIHCATVAMLLASPVHYLQTRIIADLVFEHRKAFTSRYLVQLLPPGLLCGLAAAAWVVLRLEPGTASPAMVAGLALYGLGLAASWQAMINIALLRWYGRLILAFVLALGSTALILGLGRPEPGLAVLATGISNAVLGLVLTALCLVSQALVRREDRGRIRETFAAEGFLLAGGWFLSLSLWVDKLLYWHLCGTPVPGTVLRLYPAWDLPVFLASLGMLPGMIQFLIYGETAFATSLRRFLNGLDNLHLNALLQTRRATQDTLRRELQHLAAVQAIPTITLALASPLLQSVVPGLALGPWLMALALVWCQFLLLCLFNFLFYYNRPKLVFACAAMALGSVLGATLATIALLPGAPPGLGPLAGTIPALVLTWRVVLHTAQNADRLILGDAA